MMFKKQIKQSLLRILLYYFMKTFSISSGLGRIRLKLLLSNA